VDEITAHSSLNVKVKLVFDGGQWRGRPGVFSGMVERLRALEARGLFLDMDGNFV
jgi:hypothetical protein